VRKIKLREGTNTASLFGSHDRHLKLIEEELGVHVSARGDEVALDGAPAAVQQAERVLHELAALTAEAAGHEAEEVVVAGKWYPATELVHQMAVWRSLDLSESNGLPIDMVIALKFPAYLVPHERKVVWLIHQHRSAYELWDHPEFADLSKQVEGPQVRDMVQRSDRIALGEAKRIFTNSANVQDRLWNSIRPVLRGAVPPAPAASVGSRATLPWSRRR